MKKILIALLLLPTFMNAQTFEGTIKWTFQSEITDPATKKKMEEAQTKMKDPATQAKMKEMEAKMNDPQFKKMMESNPQLKQQMEAMMKASASGDMNSMMPSSFVVEIKGNNTHTKMEGGMMGKMEMLYLKDKNQSYRIDREGKTYSIMTPPTSSEHKPEVTITKTSETRKILNYNCTKSIAESTMGGHKTQQIFWTTTEIKGLDMKSIGEHRMGNGSPSMYYDKLDGVPLRVEMINATGKMTMEAAEVKRQSLSDANFAIPSDFKEVKMPTGMPH